MVRPLILTLLLISASTALVGWQAWDPPLYGPDDPEFWWQLDEPATELDATIWARLADPFESIWDGLRRGFDGLGSYTNEAGMVEPHGRAIVYNPPDGFVVTGWYNDGLVSGFVARYFLDGTLDTAFGTAGVTRLFTAGHDVMFHAITTDGQGRYLAAGKWRDTADGDYSFLVARYLTTGVLDPSFATVGFTTIAVNTTPDRSQIARAIGVDSNQRIIVGGYTENHRLHNIDMGLVRLLSDGSLDPDFDGDGRVMTMIDSYGHDVIYGLRILSNNQIVVAGQSRNSLSATDVGDFMVARYDTNGALDPNFDTDGLLVSTFSNEDRFYGLTIDGPTGEIITCSRVLRTATQHNAGFFRYGTNGATLFNAGYNFGNDSYCRGVERNENGGFVFTGKRRNGLAADWEFLTGRLNPNLTLDTSFSTDGYDLTNIVAGDDVSHGIAYHEGKFIAAGYANMDLTIATTQNGIAILRMDSTGIEAGGGEMDFSFNGVGYNSVDIFGDNEVGGGIVRDSQNRYIVGGHTENGAGVTQDFAVTRFLSSGALDTSFGTGGWTVTPVSTADTDQVFDIVIDGLDRPYLIGFSEAGNGNTRDFAIVRYTSNGIEDNSWGVNGIVRLDRANRLDQAHEAIFGTDGRLYVVGVSRTTNQDSEDFAVVRLFSDGSHDTAFGTAGWATADFGGFGDQAFSVVLTTLNEPIVVGWAAIGSSAAADRELGVARFTNAGALDGSWGTGGLATLEINTAFQESFDDVLLTADGGIIAAGTLQDTVDAVILVRYTSNGVLDSNFGTTAPGYTIAFNTDNVNQLVRRIAYNPHGKLVVSGNQMIARFHTNGALDSYGGLLGYGRPTQAPGAEVLQQLHYQEDGRIITGGTINNNLGIMRIWP